MAGPSRGLAWLDWLRFGAAFAVLFDHTKQFSLVPYGDLPPAQQGLAVEALFAATRLGQPAVVLFFVISGYLVGGRLLEKLRAGEFDLSIYMIDRATRVLVPLLPAVLLSVVLPGGATSPGTVLGNMLGLQGTLVPVLANNGSLWTLAYEIWFYVLAGGLAVLFAGRRQAVGLLVVAIAAGFLTALQSHYLLCWLLGAAAWLWQPARPSAGWLVLAGALLVIGCAAVELGTPGVMQAGDIALLPVPVTEIGLAAGSALLIPQLVAAGEPRGRAQPIYRLGTPLAAFSYSLYLTHYPVLVALGTIGPPAPALSAAAAAMFALRLGVALAVGLAMFWLFEARTPAVRRQLRRWVRGPASGPPGES